MEKNTHFTVQANVLSIIAAYRQIPFTVIEQFNVGYQMLLRCRCNKICYCEVMSLSRMVLDNRNASFIAKNGLVNFRLSTKHLVTM